MGILKTASALLVLSVAGLASAQIYDLHKDFTIEANPHLTWSFGSSKTVTGFEPYTNNKVVEDFYATKLQGELNGWSRPDGVFPYAARNEGSSVLYQHWNPGDVVLSPSNDLFSIVRWTNPASRLTAVKMYVTFRRIENLTDYVSEWYILANGKVIDYGTLSLRSEERSVTEAFDVAPGGAISLVVGCKDHMDGTELSVNATINAGPR